MPIPTTQAPHLYGVIGQGGPSEPLDPELLHAQYDAGIRGRLVELGWDILQPQGPADWNSSIVSSFQERIDAFVSSGPDVQLYLDLGLQYPPAWASALDPLVDQHGTVWQARINGGGVNVYWSPTVRAHVAAYIQRIFTSFDFKGRLWAVRVGPSRGEMLFPLLANADGSQSFWAFDPHAQALNPVPDWRPGQPSPNGEARIFYYWYVDRLVETFNFHFTEIRRYYSGYIAPVTPGQGVWDGFANSLISRNLLYPGMCCYGTGNYWQRVYTQFPPASEGVLNWCSSVGDKSGNDGSPNWWEWSSAKQHAFLARANGRQIYAENPGRNAYDASGGADPRSTMIWIFASVRDNDYLGLMWARQSQMSDPRYASLEQYRYMISLLP